MLLKDQDRTTWDLHQIESAVVLIERAGRLRRPGPYQIEAAIQAVHCESSTWEGTDWPQLAKLYSLLEAYDATPVVGLNRAIVIGQVEGPEVALGLVEALKGSLGGYYLFHATRAALLQQVGRSDEAGQANWEALRLTSNAAEQAMLRDRLSSGLGSTSGGS